MNRNRVLFFVVLAVLLLVGLILYLWPRPHPAIVSSASVNPIPAVSNSSSQSTVKTLPDGRPAPVDPEAAKRGEKEKLKPDPKPIEAFKQALMTPFSCWGKVVDENGNAISGADVNWSANNNLDPYKSGTKGQTTSDNAGMFSVSSHGIGLYVKVSKTGYYSFPTDIRRQVIGSDRGFSTGGRLGNTDTPMGTKDNPAIFVLRKMGETVPLLVRGVNSPVRKDGTPVEIDLETGRVVAEGKGDIRVQAWTNNEGLDSNLNQHYDWRCVISVPNGGLIKREGQFAFEAPADGYQPSDEITMSQSAERWVPQASCEYFLKLSDNHYARINFQMIAGGDHFFMIESYLNPMPGNRNLEFDPAKEIKAK